MSYFSECVIALRTSVNEKIDAFENNTPEVVRNYLEELGGITLYSAVFGNPQSYYEYQRLQRTIARYEVPVEDFVDADPYGLLYYANEVRSRRDNREKLLKEEYKILFDLNTAASRKTFEQILVHDNEWSAMTKELSLYANAFAKQILHEVCLARGYNFE